MKRFFQMGLFSLAVAAVLSSCSFTGPVCATSNAVGSKVGESSGTGYLRFIMLGIDCSIRTAARNGNISKISTVDFKQTDLLGLVQNYTTIVTGE